MNQTMNESQLPQLHPETAQLFAAIFLIGVKMGMNGNPVRSPQDVDVTIPDSMAIGLMAMWPDAGKEAHERVIKMARIVYESSIEPFLPGMTIPGDLH